MVGGAMIRSFRARSLFGWRGTLLWPLYFFPDVYYALFVPDLKSSIVVTF